MPRRSAAPALLLALLLLARPAAAQDLDLFNQASEAEDVGRYEEAARLYTRVLDTGGEASSSAPTLHYLAATSFAQAGQTDEAFSHLQSALDGGFGPLQNVKDDESLQSLHDDARWAALMNTTEARRTSINQAVRAELLAMGEQDQAVRQPLTEAGIGALSDALTARMDSVDAAHQARLKEIIGEHGWPGPNLVGPDGANAAFLIVQHAGNDLPFQQRALALLQEAYARGEAPGDDLALLTDRVRVNEGKKQLYGTQILIENDTIAFQPIEDPAHLDARRAAMGLPPLEQYAKMLGDMYQVEVRMP